MKNKKKVTRIVVATASLFIATFSVTAFGMEYHAQKEDLRPLELTAQELTGDIDFYDPDSGYWVDGEVDENNAAYNTLHATFPNNEVFDTPEWLAYDVLAKNQDLLYKESDLNYLREASEAITFPGLNGRASEAYETIEENIYESGTLHQGNLLYEAGHLVSNSETKEEALELASEWDFNPRFSDPNNAEYTLASSESYYLTFWGIEDPSKENLDIAREGIKKALVVAVDEHYDVLKNRN